MARTKEFEESEVLDRAVELFRERGFQATSFGDLTADLGVSRQSLYDTFGDKQAFFLAALKLYRDKALESMRRILSAPGPVRPQLQKLFDGNIDFACSGGSYGCLMINTMIEQAPADGATRAFVSSHGREVEALLAQRLSAAQRAGEIGFDQDPVALARFLHHAMLGLGVAARAATGDRESLRESARMALRVLG